MSTAPLVSYTTLDLLMDAALLVEGMPVSHRTRGDQNSHLLAPPSEDLPATRESPYASTSTVTTETAWCGYPMSNSRDEGDGPMGRLGTIDGRLCRFLPSSMAPPQLHASTSSSQPVSPFLWSASELSSCRRSPPGPNMLDEYNARIEESVRYAHAVHALNGDVWRTPTVNGWQECDSNPSRPVVIAINPTKPADFPSLSTSSKASSKRKRVDSEASTAIKAATKKPRTPRKTKITKAAANDTITSDPAPPKKKSRSTRLTSRPITASPSRLTSVRSTPKPSPLRNCLQLDDVSDDSDATTVDMVQTTGLELVAKLEIVNAARALSADVSPSHSLLSSPDSPDAAKVADQSPTSSAGSSTSSRTSTPCRAPSVSRSDSGSSISSASSDRTLVLSPPSQYLLLAKTDFSTPSLQDEPVEIEVVETKINLRPRRTRTPATKLPVALTARRMKVEEDTKSTGGGVVRTKKMTRRKKVAA